MVNLASLLRHCTFILLQVTLAKLKPYNVVKTRGTLIVFIQNVYLTTNDLTHLQQL